MRGDTKGHTNRKWLATVLFIATSVCIYKLNLLFSPSTHPFTSFMASSDLLTQQEGNSSTLWLLPAHARSAEEANIPYCTDPLVALLHGEWVKDKGEFCNATEVRKKVLCSGESKMMYGEKDPRGPGFVWHPKGCKLRLLSAAEACQVLQKARAVYITGESIQRHLYIALLLILSGDYETGALSSGLTQEWSERCGGNNQFSQKECRAKIRQLDVDPIRSCPVELVGNRTAPMTLLSLWHSFFFLKAPSMALNNTNNWLVHFRELPSSAKIVVGLGLHDSLNLSHVESSAVVPVLRFLNSQARRASTARPEVIWMSPPAQGPLKPEKYLREQGNAALINFTSAADDMARRLQVGHLNPFNMTLEAHSYDGTHYSRTVNVMLAQAVLNQWSK